MCTLFIAACFLSSVQSVLRHRVFCVCIMFLYLDAVQALSFTQWPEVYHRLMFLCPLTGRILKSCLMWSSQTHWSLVSFLWSLSRGPSGPLVSTEWMLPCPHPQPHFIGQIINHLWSKMSTNSEKHPSQVSRIRDLFISLTLSAELVT